MTKGVSQDLRRLIRHKSYIEECGPEVEEFIMREICKGQNFSQIVVSLNKNFKDMDFTYQKLLSYQKRNREIHKLVMQMDFEVAKRTTDRNIDWRDKIFKVVELTEEEIENVKKNPNYDPKDVFTGLKTMIAALIADARLSGRLNEGSTHNQYNFIQQFSEGKQGIKEQVLRASFEIPGKPLPSPENIIETKGDVKSEPNKKS